MKIGNVIKALLVSFVVLVAGFTANIYLHELGHWAVANHFGLNPQISTGSAITGLAALDLTGGTPLIWTSYRGAGALNGQDALIAFAGPAVNIAIAVIATLLYLAIPRRKRTPLVNLIFIMVLIPAVLSAVANLIPIAPSDGWVIFSYLAR